MKARRMSLTAIVTVFMMLVVAQASLAGESQMKYASRPSPQETAAWWQWAFQLPPDVHPLTILKDENTQSCSIGQQGDTWFIGGIFDQWPIAPFDRKCKIPYGNDIVSPVLNAECSESEGDADTEKWGGKTPKQALRKCARAYTEGIIAVATITEGPRAPYPPFPEIETDMDPDGDDYQEFLNFELPGKPLGVHRVASKVFSVAIPDPNVVGIPPMANSLSASNGEWIKLRKLPPGTYTVWFKGYFEEGHEWEGFFILGAYELEIVENGAEW